MPEKRDNSIHVRLTNEADAMAEFLSESLGIDKNKLVTEYIHDALLGRGHTLKVAALRLSRSGFVGNNREGGGA